MFFVPTLLFCPVCFIHAYLKEIVDAVALHVLRAGAAAQHQRRATVSVAVIHVRSWIVNNVT